MENNVRLLASHPDYNKFLELQTLICVAMNPSVFYSEEPIDMPEAEISALKEILLGEMSKLIENYHSLPSGIAKIINFMEYGE